MCSFLLVVTVNALTPPICLIALFIIEFTIMSSVEHFAQREIALPDDQVIEVCSLAYSIVDRTLRNPQNILEEAMVLSSIPHRNYFVPADMQFALRGTRLGELETVYIPLRGAEENRLQIDAIDQDHPHRRLTFTAYPEGFFVSDSRQADVRRANKETEMRIKTKTVARWLLAQGAGLEDDPAIDIDTEHTLMHAARLLEARAGLKTTVAVGREPIRLPNGSINPFATLHAQRVTSWDVQNPFDTTPHDPHIALWVTAKSSFDTHGTATTTRLVISFRPEKGILTNEPGATSIRVEFDGQTVNPDRTDALLANSALEFESKIIEQLKKILEGQKEASRLALP